MKNIKKNFLYVLWILITVLIFALLIFLGHFSLFKNFGLRMEKATFDIRQSIISNYKQHNSNIAIVGIDDASYEYIMDKFGSWPLSRKVWADVAENIEKANPKYIIFDLMFLKPDLNNKSADIALVNIAKKYNNIYFPMNFDNYSSDIRIPPKFDDKFKLTLKNSGIKSSEISFINARGAMEELAEATKNIASINIIRDDDGIIRKISPFYIYRGEYYPNLTFLVALDYFGKKEVETVKNSLIIDKNHIIPLDNTARAVLNWYGKSDTFKHIPLWEVLKAIKTSDSKFLKENFENKIIYIGSSATSLSDVKSVPTDFHFDGVEIQATFLNNILDNNFIKKVSIEVDIIVSIVLCVFIGYFVLRTANILKTFMFLIAVLFLYIVFTTYAMQKFNLWFGLSIPFVSVILTFISVYCEKYFLKSKDYEQTYKLAVTDGLTQLYNHRYFQEQMILAVNNFHRYGNKFSLILIDIDFFKKFNDTYGHQSGDCVLKQVANILKRNSRTSDIVCRYGGEEMTIILTNTNKEEAVITANKICNAIRENKFILSGGQQVNVTISVGVATVGDDASKPQELIEYSDKCLYRAKENGRNQVVSNV